MQPQQKTTYADCFGVAASASCHVGFNRRVSEDANTEGIEAMIHAARGTLAANKRLKKGKNGKKGEKDKKGKKDDGDDEDDEDSDDEDSDDEESDEGGGAAARPRRAAAPKKRPAATEKCAPKKRGRPTKKREEAAPAEKGGATKRPAAKGAAQKAPTRPPPSTHPTAYRGGTIYYSEHKESFRVYARHGDRIEAAVRRVNIDQPQNFQAVWEMCLDIIDKDTRPWV